MKESSRWAQSSFALLLVFCILGGFLVGSSSSQDARVVRETTEVGRYQFVNGHQIFDTKTARLWQYDDSSLKWNREDAPWEWNQNPRKQPRDIQPNDGYRPIRPRAE